MKKPFLNQEERFMLIHGPDTLTAKLTAIRYQAAKVDKEALPGTTWMLYLASAIIVMEIITVLL